jgi:pyridoxamine-phosphate oxidase
MLNILGRCVFLIYNSLAGMKKNSSFFSETTSEPDPFLQFRNWFEERASSFKGEIFAAALSTADRDYRISTRMVLVKEFGETGFVFYTNYESRKGIQLTENPVAALLYFWPELKRQVRIEGTIEKVAPEISDKYFQTRPRESQLSAIASNQSKVIPGKKYLMDRVDSMSEYYRDKVIPRPANWGGFCLMPDWFEFWQEGENRLHDRISYTLTANSWKISRLAP